MDDLYFEIKGGGNFVKFRIINPPQYHDPEDWALVDMTFNCGSFSGAYTANIMVGHFFCFYEDLSKLCENLKGDARFYDKGILEVYVKGDNFGHFIATVQACDIHEGSKLEYQIDFDQSYLPEMLTQLGQIVKQRPSK